MTEDDIRAVVRALKEAQAEAFDGMHARFDALERRFDALEHHVNDMEAGWVNLIRDMSKRIDRLE